MHHWTVHEKVDFLKFPRYWGGAGGYSTTFDPELRIEVKNFPMLAGGSIPQLLILNSEMKDLH